MLKTNECSWDDLLSKGRTLKITFNKNLTFEAPEHVVKKHSTTLANIIEGDAEQTHIKMKTPSKNKMAIKPVIILLKMGTVCISDADIANCFPEMFAVADYLGCKKILKKLKDEFNPEKASTFFKMKTFQKQISDDQFRHLIEHAKKVHPNHFKPQARTWYAFTTNEDAICRACNETGNVSLYRRSIGNSQYHVWYSSTISKGTASSKLAHWICDDCAPKETDTGYLNMLKKWISRKDSAWDVNILLDAYRCMKK